MVAPNPSAAGYVARMNREPIRSCPDRGRDHQKAWEQGWLRADLQLQAKVKYVAFVYRYGDTGETYSTFALATDVEYGEKYSEARTVAEHAKANGVEHVGTWYVMPKKSFKRMVEDYRKLRFQILDVEASKTR